MHRWKSFVAIGDSFTEGLNDPGPNGQYRGWADRLAERLAVEQPELRYANLAVRGKYVDQVLTDQLPFALASGADLVSFCAGGNDILRPSADPDAIADHYETGVAQLREAGSEVMIFTGFDTRPTPVLKYVRGRVATYNGHLRAIADRHDCLLVDIWSMRILQDPRAWSPDRLHLSSAGHHRVALRAAEVLGVEVDADWNEPWPPMAPPTWSQLRRSDWEWTTAHFLPWVGRHLRGRSSGDNVPPKRPELLPVISGEMA